LSPAALFEWVRKMQSGDVEVLYSHEAEVDAEGKNVERFLSKPRFSWFDLIHFDYVGPNFAVSKKVFENAGGFNPSLHPHGEHDLLLRLHEKKTRFGTVPSFLYYH